MTVLLSAVIPVAFIILVGFIAAKTLSLDRQTLSQLTLYVLSPALIVSSLYQTTLSARSISLLLGGLALTASVLYLSAWAIAKIFRFPSILRNSLTATVLFPNNGNMGLPFITFALGSAGLERAVIYMIGSSIVMYGVGPALLKGKGIGFGIRMTVRLPFFWAILTGLSLRLLSVQLPFKLDTGIARLGEAAIPLALIILGIQLAHTQFELGIKEFLAAGMRLLYAPLIAYFVGRTLGLDGLDLQVLILQSAMPTAVSTIVLVTQFGGDATWVARAIVLSTLMSFVTLPLVLWLTGGG